MTETETSVDVLEDIQKDIQEQITLTLDKLTDINQVFDYVKLIMEALEQQPLPGKMKKELALNILRNIMEKSDLGIKQKAEGIALIDNNIISNAIDIIIVAASGEMEINMPTTSATASASASTSASASASAAASACSNFIIPCGISFLSKKPI